MNKLLKMNLAILVFLCLAVSCRKNKSETPVPDDNLNTAVTQEEISHSENPFDLQGNLHNQFLDLYIQEIKTPQKIEEDKALALFNSFSNRNNLGFDEKDSRKFVRMFEEVEEAAAIGGPYVEYFCDKYPLICKLETSEMMKKVQSSLKDIDWYGSENTKEEIIHFMKDVKTEEKRILEKQKEDQMTEMAEAKLIYCAVIRYSVAYWYNVGFVKDKKNSWTKDLSKEQIAAICWDCVAQADAVGAMVGNILGGNYLSGTLSALLSAFEYARQPSNPV